VSRIEISEDIGVDREDDHITSQGDESAFIVNEKCLWKAGPPEV
jgi:hypothetical protein